MSNIDDNRIPICQDDLGPGKWREMLSALYDEDSNPSDIRVMFVARFGVFSDVRSWGRMLASMIRTLAAGEAKSRSLPESAIEGVEAQIVEGFNDVTYGGDSYVVRKPSVFKMEHSQKNWTIGKIKWPFPHGQSSG